MKALFTLLLLLPLLTFAQNTGDSKIIINPAAKDSVYLKIKHAFAKSNFMLKEDGNTDTLRSFPANLNGIPGYATIMAVIKQDGVELSGFYGLSRIDDMGYTRNPNKYKPILYFKGSKAWKQLSEVATKIGYSSVSYTK